MIGIGMQNFQAVRDYQEVLFHGITLIYGQNSSGKSTLKDAIFVGSELSSKKGDAMPVEWVHCSEKPATAIARGCDTILKYSLLCFLYKAEPRDWYDSISELFDGELEFRRGQCKFLDGLFEAALKNDYPLASIEYRWSLLYGEPKLVGLKVDYAGDWLLELNLISNVGRGDPERRVRINLNNALLEVAKVELDSSWLYCKSFEVIDCEAVAADLDLGWPGTGIDDALEIGEVLFKIQKSEIPNQEEVDPVFLFIYIFTNGLTEVLRRVCMYDFVGGIRPESEESARSWQQGDGRLPRHYWNTLKYYALEAWLIGEERALHASQINQWLCNEDFLGTGFKMDIDVKVLASPEDVENLRNPNFNVKEFYFNSDLSSCRLMLFDVKREVKVEVSDVGTGVSQVFPILYSLAQPFLGLNIYVQQPELHLHPSMQASLADVFVDSFVKREKGYVYVLETHSELFLLRLLRRIREGFQSGEPLILAEDVNVIYADRDGDGVTTYKNLRVSEDGDFLDRWPKGFFAERDNEIFW